MNRKTIVLVVAAVAVVLVGLRLTVFAPKPDDRALVLKALDESILASKEGRPGGVLDFISLRLTVNEDQVGRNRRDIADWIRRLQPNVKLDNRNVVVDDVAGVARIVTPVTVEYGLLGTKREARFGEVTMTFQKEDGRNYLVIPTRKWRLTEVQVPTESIPSEWMSGALGM